MGSGVLVQAGRETGETLVGHNDFQLADDVQRKIHYGHYTMYLRAVVYKHQNVAIAENMFSMGYVGGDDVSFFDEESHDAFLQGETSAHKSMFSCLVPYVRPTQEFYPNPMDITGRFSSSIHADANGADHYLGARYYGNKWRWAHEEGQDRE